MKRKSIVALTFVLALAAGACLLLALGGPVQAQQVQVHEQGQHGCKAFHGVVQGSLPTSYPILSTDTWGGPVYANLGGELLIGGMSGNDGTELPHGAVSVFTNGAYTVCLGNSGDCFTYQVPHAFVIWPTADRLGSYNAMATIVKGTNRFQSASGRLNIAGPFIGFWPDPNSQFGVGARWNGEFSGSICGIQ